jgi:hypothetical protein
VHFTNSPELETSVINTEGHRSTMSLCLFKNAIVGPLVIRKVILCGVWKQQQNDLNLTHSVLCICVHMCLSNHLIYAYCFAGVFTSHILSQSSTTIRGCDIIKIKKCNFHTPKLTISYYNLIIQFP